MLDQYDSVTYKQLLANTFYFTVISALIFGAGKLGITEPLQYTLSLLVSPSIQGVNVLKLKISNEVNTITEARVITNKYKAINEQNLVLRSEAAQLTLLEKENQQLRDQLGAPSVERFKLAPARVVNQDREMNIIFDKNTLVAKDSIVAYKNNFVGRVRSNTNRTATVLLPTDPDLNIPVDIITSDKKVIKGELKGEFGTGIIADRIQQDVTINKGDLVVLAKAPGLPEGIVVGEVRETHKRESELFQKAKVEPFIQYDLLDTVFIIQ